MNKKYKIRSDYLFLFLMILINTCFFGFYGFLPFAQNFYIYDYKYILILFVSFIFFFFSLIKNRFKIKFSKSNRLLTISFFLIILLEVVLSYISYHQPIILVLKEASYNIIILFAYFTFVQLYKSLNFEEILKLIVIFGLITSSISLFSAFIFNHFNINILGLVIENASIRNDKVRFFIGEETVILGVIISITRIFSKKNKTIDVLNIIISLLQIYFVSQTRSLILYLILIILLILFFNKKTNLTLKLLMISVSSIFILYIILNFRDIETYINSYIGGDSSISIRFKTIDFYMNQFYQKPWFGMGYISSSKDIDDWQLLYGPEGYYYRSDVGIIGNLNQYGIIGLLWIIAFFYKNIKYSAKEKQISIYHLIIFNFSAFLMLSLINLSFLTVQLLMYLFYILIFSFIHEKTSTIR